MSSCQPQRLHCSGHVANIPIVTGDCNRLPCCYQLRLKGSKSLLSPLNSLLAGLKATDGVVLLDRQQGGDVNLTNNKFNIRSVFNISEILELLLKEGDIDQETVKKTLKFIEENKLF